MRNVKRRFIGGAVSAGCALAVATGFAIAEKSNSEAIPVSLGIQKELPVIVLDAGHGECS